LAPEKQNFEAKNEGWVLKILSSHEWVALGIALFTTPSWAITSVSGKA